MNTKREREIIPQDEYFFTCIGWIWAKRRALYVALFNVIYCHCLNNNQCIFSFWFSQEYIYFF